MKEMTRSDNKPVINHSHNEEDTLVRFVEFEHTLTAGDVFMLPEVFSNNTAGDKIKFMLTESLVKWDKYSPVNCLIELVPVGINHSIQTYYLDPQHKWLINALWEVLENYTVKGGNLIFPFQRFDWFNHVELVEEDAQNHGAYSHYLEEVYKLIEFLEPFVSSKLMSDFIEGKRKIS